MKRILQFMVMAALLLVAGNVSAHHGNAAFENAKTVSVKATVTEWIWSNPHCFLKFDAPDEQGKVVNWVAETSNPPDMIARGWTKRSFKSGDQVTVTMIVAKNGVPVGRVREVILADGTKLSASGGPAPSAP
ncbi:MAG: DUF6152 family protein [Vicinamibacterales bacterium]